jgi:hypothetical protein
MDSLRSQHSLDDLIAFHASGIDRLTTSVDRNTGHQQDMVQPKINTSSYLACSATIHISIVAKPTIVSRLFCYIEQMMNSVH